MSSQDRPGMAWACWGLAILIWGGVLMWASNANADDYQYIALDHGSSLHGGPPILGFGNGSEETDWNMVVVGTRHEFLSNDRGFFDLSLGWHIDEPELQGRGPWVQARIGFKLRESK